MFKFVIFYGGALLAILGSFILWIAIPPKYTIKAICDEADREIQCTVSGARSLGRHMRLCSIWIPTEYVQRLGASPPSGFKHTSTLVPTWLYDDAKREVAVWSGWLDIPKGRTIELSIPAAHPKAVTGTIQFGIECWGVANVGCQYDTVEAALKSDDA